MLIILYFMYLAYILIDSLTLQNIYEIYIYFDLLNSQIKRSRRYRQSWIEYVVDSKKS
jgi:hypothetical protein